MSWLVLALLSAVSAALVAIFAKMGLSGVDSTTATAVRSVIMAVALIFTALIVGKLPQANDLQSRDWILIMLSGLAGAASWLFYFGALKLGPASKVATIDRLSLVFVIILAALFLGEKLTIKVVIGGALMFLGALFITVL